MPSISDLSSVEILLILSGKYKSKQDEMRIYESVFRSKVDDVFLVVFPIMFMVFNLIYWPLCLHSGKGG